MRKAVITIIVAVLGLAAAHAQDASSVAMPFAAVPRSVRTLSMGGTDTGDGAAFKVLGEQKFSAGASWCSWAPGATPSKDINLDIYARLGSRLGLSALLASDGGEAYTIYDATGKAGASFKPKDLMFKVGLAYSITPIISLGVDGRILKSTLTAKNSYSAFAGDVHVAAKLGDARVVAGVANLGASVAASDGTAFGLPTSARLAGDYGLSIGESLSLDARAQADWFFTGGLRAGAGVELGYSDLAFVRLGYNYGGNTVLPSYASVGAGVKLAGFAIDFAYLLGSDTLGGSLAIGLGYSF